MKHLINNFYYVEVPEGVYWWKVSERNRLWVKASWRKDTQFPIGYLPNDSYSILATTQEILQSEELAKQVVRREDNMVYSLHSDSYAPGCFDYLLEEYRQTYTYTDSFQSLLTAHNVPINSLILKKND